MASPITQQERKSIGLSAIASIVGMTAILAPVLWFVVRPVLVSSVSDAMASEMEETIDRKLAPVNAGFKALLQQNINTLRREIAEMEYQRQAGEWTSEDARELAQLEIDLDGQLAALQAIVTAEK